MEVVRPKTKSKGRKKTKKKQEERVSETPEEEAPLETLVEQDIAEDGEQMQQEKEENENLSSTESADPRQGLPTVLPPTTSGLPILPPITPEESSQDLLGPFRSPSPSSKQVPPSDGDLISFGDSLPPGLEPQLTQDTSGSRETVINSETHVDKDTNGRQESPETVTVSSSKLTEPIGDRQDGKERVSDVPSEQVAMESVSQAAVHLELTNVDISSQSAVIRYSAGVVHSEGEELAQRTDIVVPAVLSHECESQVLPLAPVASEGLQASEEVGVASAPLYPVMDSLIAAYAEPSEEVVTPFSEEDLSLFYPNPQLQACPDFTDNFIRESQQEHHQLYELLMQYLKARLALKAAECKVDGLKKEYADNHKQIWSIVNKSITSNGKCRDGTKVSHNHTYKQAAFNARAADRTGNNLKNLRDALQEELCMQSYSCQLARIHVEYFLHQLLQTYPQVTDNSPVTGYIPMCGPGELDSYTQELRNCISVLFAMERRPVRDKEFSADCRRWLDLLLSILLRVASLSDHMFILNHLLRCPPGLNKWAVKYLQPLQPCPVSVRANAGGGQLSYWGASSAESGRLVLDHLIAMLGTLLQPVIAREEFLALLAGAPPTSSSRQCSQPWTFVEMDVDEDVDEGNHLMMKESDFIALFDQFPLTEMFRHVLGVSQEGGYTVAYTSSHQMLQLLAFCTCLIRLLGESFATLRQACYKEFVKQVGRTIRQMVHYVADHWINYKSLREQAGDGLHAPPASENPGLPRYSLARLQVEFDQFVLRATQWILTAHRLGAWQFMADMPYNSIALLTLWQILWTLYHYQLSSHAHQSTRRPSGIGAMEDGRNRTVSVLLDFSQMPQTAEEIQHSVRDDGCHAQFVDVLMKTYTSESVFLLTTFVNMARARAATSGEEIAFINFVSLEIFQFTQIEEYAREAYSSTGANLLGSIAMVHPFMITTLLDRVQDAILTVGENCVLLYKELPLHLWEPTERDMEVIHHWLVACPLTSHENSLARVILQGLNWGTQQDQSGGYRLVLDPSLHRSVALMLVEAHSRHLSTGPGGYDYNPVTSTLSKYASSLRAMISSDQSEFTSWSWEIVLMLKLHPTQLSILSLFPPSPHPPNRSSHSRRGSFQSTTPPNPVSSQYHPAENTEVLEQGAKSASVYKMGGPIPGAGFVEGIDLPSMANSDIPGFEHLRDSVQRQGLVASYVAMSLSSMGSEVQEFLSSSLPALHRLVEQGYYLPVLRVVANLTPFLAQQRKMVLDEQSFVQLILSVANADANNISLRERLSFSSPEPLILKRLSALITTQLYHSDKTGVSADLVLYFWLETLLTIPSWLRESSVLYLFNGICQAVFGREELQKLVITKLLEQYQLLQPLQQKNRRLLSSVTSSVLSIVGQDGGPPSLHSAVSKSEYPWFSYFTLCAEQEYEISEGVWRTLLTYLKKDQKITVDSALKKSLTDLRHHGSGFISSHLAIYKWADFCSSVDTSFPLFPLVWQKFFALYLQRPLLNSSMPERFSLGLRFFSNSQTQSRRRSMKAALSAACKSLQQEMDTLGQPSHANEPGRERSLDFLPKIIKYYRMLRMWLEEPRLHDSEVHLPSLPVQYDSQRLTLVFQPQQVEWVEFVRVWEVNESVKMQVKEWVQVASYQKPLQSETESRDSSPQEAVARIERRLQRSTNTVRPPSLNPLSLPFQLVSPEVLLSKDALLAVANPEFTYLAQQARLFSERVSTMAALDLEYTTGIPDLYRNQPKQFHVSVPCHKKSVCAGPATIVFRFEELTSHLHWEQRLTQNRAEHHEITTALSMAVPHDFCRAVTKLEHIVGELSKMSSSHQSTENNVALACGVALFYELLKYIKQDTRRFPPSCQFLTSCVEILGQAFIQNDPSQTLTILQLMLNHRLLGDLLAPLFQPNSCPEDFITMYSSVGEVAVKEGPAIAFSVLTKFSLTQWLEVYQPIHSDCSQLLQQVVHGIALCGHTPSQEAEVLLELYRTHLRQLVDHQFPQFYNEALHHLVNNTDTCSICASCWDDLSEVSTPRSSGQCRMGLQLVQESAKFLSEHFMNKRIYAQEFLYELLSHDFIPAIGGFLSMLSAALVTKCASSVDVGNCSSSDALMSCWQGVINLFTPWIVPLDMGNEGGSLYPCKVEHAPQLAQMVGLFVEAVSLMHSQFSGYGESVLGMFWSYYCTSLSVAGIPDHVVHCYHASFSRLPWNTFIPSLPAIDAMMKLKLVKTHSPSSFAFLGEIFPLFNWEAIIAAYQSSADETLLVQLYIMLLQLLVMLAAEPEVMQNKEAQLPKLLSDAKKFDWQYIDIKTYSDVLRWQKENCNPVTILQAGSPLSIAIRLLKASASFPTSPNSNLLRLHKDPWAKRIAFIQLIVELLAAASKQKATHFNSYSDVLGRLFKTVVDVAIFEPHERASPNSVALLQEIINLFNLSHPSEDFQGSLLSHVFIVLEQMPSAEHICLPVVTAACRTLVKVDVMVQMVEHALLCHFKSLPAPNSRSLQLPPVENKYGWIDARTALDIPESVTKEFCNECIGSCLGLSLHAHLLEMFTHCTSIEQEYHICCNLVQWCGMLKPKKPSDEPKVFVIWEKAIGLLLRQTRFSGRVARIVPHLTTMATIFQRFGEDKTTEGLLGAIGLGKKSPYSHQFRLISRTMAAFLFCQMPVDSSQSTLLRITPNASGHIKDPSRSQLGATLHASPTKQAEQIANSLEGLLTNKSYSQLKEFISYSLVFLHDVNHNLMNSTELLVYLCTVLYPEERYLDTLRVLQA